MQSNDLGYTVYGVEQTKTGKPYVGVCLGGTWDGQLKSNHTRIIDVAEFGEGFFDDIRSHTKDGTVGYNTSRYYFMEMSYDMPFRENASEECYNFWIHESIGEGEEFSYVIHRFVELSKQVNECKQCLDNSVGKLKKTKAHLGNRRPNGLWKEVK